jgi:hypothetical protein
VATNPSKNVDDGCPQGLGYTAGVPPAIHGKMTRLPDFIIVGAGKSGTSSLQGYLQQHPQIYLCPKKETFYFLNERVRANSAKWGAVQTLEEYRELFAAAQSDQVVGEISTTYYADPKSARLIHGLLPDVKILAILRNPIDRAFSDYQMHVNNGSEKRTFAEVVGLDIKYINCGFYHQQLQHYYEVFPPEQIKVLLYDDYCQDAQAFLQSIFDFIGVDSQFVADTSTRARVGGVPKRQWVRQLLAEKNPLRTLAASLLKLFMPLEARQKIRSQLLKKNTVRTQLDEVSFQRLATLYQDDVNQLQTLLDRNLSHWLQPRKSTSA